MCEPTHISQEAPRSAAGAPGKRGPFAEGGFRHVLVVTEPAGSGVEADADAGAKAAAAAAAVAHEWADAFGGDVATLELSETRGLRQWTLGARSHRLAEEIAVAAEARDADVIVLGIDRRRMARRHLAPSLRAQPTRETALPVLVAPASVGVSARGATGATHEDLPATKAREDAEPYAHV
jgi:hypothetical protein